MKNATKKLLTISRQQPAYPDPQERFETAKRIAARLHQTASTIYDWTRHPDNPLPCYRVTNRVTFFLWSEVAAWIKAGGTLKAA